VNNHFFRRKKRKRKMKKKLQNSCLWILLLFFGAELFAQADPSFTSINPLTSLEQQKEILYYRHLNLFHLPFQPLELLMAH